MSKLIFFFFFIYGCSSNKRLNSFSEVGRVSPRANANILGNVDIVEDDYINRRKQKSIVFLLSKETSLCIPELTKLTGWSFRFAQLRSLSLIKYLESSNLDWSRYYLVEKFLKQKQDYSIINKEVLKKINIEKMFSKLPGDIYEASNLENEIRDSYNHLLKNIVIKKFNKKDDIIVSDKRLSLNSLNFIKIEALRDVNSFTRLKKKCELISEQFKEALIRE